MTASGLKDPKRIFDPFYTTKNVEKARDWGLSICYGIVKEHGGDITAHNAPEGGAIIEVRLPLVELRTRSRKIRRPRPRAARLQFRGVCF